MEALRAAGEENSDVSSGEGAEARGLEGRRSRREIQVQRSPQDVNPAVPQTVDAVVKHYSDMKSLARQFSVARNLAVKPWGRQGGLAGGAACGYGSSADSDLSLCSQTEQADSS